MATGPYGKLNVPQFTDWDASQSQSGYFQMILANIGAGTDVTQRINDVNQAELTRALVNSLGEGYGETWEEGRAELRQQARGEFSAEKETMFRNMLTADAQRLGINASGASLNLKTSGMGQAMMQMQSRALQQLPGYLTSEQRARTATPTRIESMFIPVAQVAAQNASDNINRWRAQFAGAQAQHQASMANTAYKLQQQQQARVESQTRNRIASSQRLAVFQQNQANLAASSARSWGLRNQDRFGNLDRRRAQGPSWARSSTNFRNLA